MNNQITEPGNIKFNDWVCDLTNTLPMFNIPVPHSMEKWKDWVHQFIIANPNVPITLPDKNIFPLAEDWKDWAVFFITDVTEFNTVNQE